MPPLGTSQPQKPVELFGKLGAPLRGILDSTGFHAAVLDAPHESHTCIVLNDGVMGWSKVKKRLGREQLVEGDPIIIRSFCIAQGALIAREIA